MDTVEWVAGQTPKTYTCRLISHNILVEGRDFFGHHTCRRFKEYTSDPLSNTFQKAYYTCRMVTLGWMGYKPRYAIVERAGKFLLPCHVSLTESTKIPGHVALTSLAA